MSIRVVVDYEGKTYKGALSREQSFADVCEMFDAAIKELTYIRLDLDDGSRLYMAEQAANRAVIRVIQE